MKRLLALLFLALTAPVGAQLCTPTEYAQYKDRAATERGLVTMAADYCLKNRILAGEMAYRGTLAQSGIRTSDRETSACSSEVAKMGDAAAAAGKSAEWRAMTATPAACDATLARLGVKPR